MRGVGARYLKEFRTVGEERTAFGRQGSEVQILSFRPLLRLSDLLSVHIPCMKFVQLWFCSAFFDLNLSGSAVTDAIL